ncbi:hypothetical protein KKC60_00745 [Patescibacteria group bacterium]|nr:hypothetical protein [Patescibacteria group bacterium]
MKTKKNVGIFLISFCIVFLLGLAFITFVDANETVAEDFKPVEEDDYCTTTAHCTTGLECDLKGTKTCQKPGSTGIGCNSTNDCNLSQNQKCDTTTKRCTDGSGREYSSCTTGGANEGGCNTQRGLKCSDYGMCVEEDKDLKKSALGQTCTDDIECRRGGTAYVCGNGKCVNETAKIVKEGENCSYKYPRAPNFNDYVCPAGTVCTHPEINSRAQYTCHQPGKKPAGDSCAGTDGKPDFSVCRIGLTCDKNKKK